MHTVIAHMKSWRGQGLLLPSLCVTERSLSLVSKGGFTLSQESREILYSWKPINNN
jgi:hypothetical protein